MVIGGMVIGGMVIGGVIDQYRSYTDEGVPGAANVPVVGNLFKTVIRFPEPLKL